MASTTFCRAILVLTALSSSFGAAVPTLAQDRPSWITGKVMDAEGRPIAGAAISLVPENEGGALYHESTAAPGEIVRETSAADGTFLVALPENEVAQWIVVAEAEGHSPRIESALPIGSDVEMVLGVGSSMRGEVLDPESRPVAGAKVHWYALERGVVPERFTTTDDEGRYEFRHLPPTARMSLWHVIVEADGFAPLAVELGPTGVPVFAGMELHRPSEVVQHFFVSPGAVVAGTVRDISTDVPLPGAEVVLWASERLLVDSDAIRSMEDPYGDRVIARTVASLDGSFRFEHVPVSCSPHGTEVRVGVGARIDGHAEARTEPFTAAEENMPGLELRLPADESPGRDLSSWMFDHDRMRGTRLAKRIVSGLRCLRGRCSVPGRPVPEGHSVLVFRGSLTERQVDEFRAKEGLGWPFLELPEPLAANEVRADGIFELRGLPAGPVWLLCGGVWLRADDPSGFVEIEVPPDPRGALVLDSISCQGTGVPVEPTVVHLRYQSPVEEGTPDLTARHFEQYGFPVGRNRYAVPHVEPGNWELRVEAPGFVDHREIVAIHDEAVVHRAIELVPLPRESDSP